MDFENILYPKILNNDQQWLLKGLKKQFVDKSSNDRVIHISSVLRGLIDIVIFDKVSVSDVKKCDWYRDETSKTGQVTKSQKMRYSLIRGVHSFEFYKIIFLEDNKIKEAWENLQKIYKNLNENIHFKDIANLRKMSIEEIDSIIEKQFQGTLEFFYSYDVVDDLIIGKIKLYLENNLQKRLSVIRPDDIWDLTILGEVGNVEVELINLLKFNENSILFESKGKCLIDGEEKEYNLQGHMSTDRLNDINIVWGKKKDGDYIPFQIIEM